MLTHKIIGYLFCKSTCHRPWIINRLDKIFYLVYIHLGVQ